MNSWLCSRPAWRPCARSVELLQRESQQLRQQGEGQEAVRLAQEAELRRLEAERAGLSAELREQQEHQQQRLE